jgi:hypothetical protein
MNGSGSGSSKAGSAHSGTSGGIGFTVSGQPTPVSIIISASVAGPDTDANASMTLNGPNGVIATMSVDSTGAVKGSIPSGTMDPGSYDLEIVADGNWNEFSNASSYNYSVTATVSAGVAPATIRWRNPEGGSFDTADNWDPRQVPSSIDTVNFNMSSLLGLIPVTAPNEGVAEMLVDGMSVELTGFVQVLQENGFAVLHGGQVVLTNGAALVTQNGMIEFGNDSGASILTVTGAGTHWTLGAAHPLLIHDSAKLIVDQGGLVNAQQEIDVGHSAGPGEIEIHNNGAVTTPVLKVAGAGSVSIDSGGLVTVQQLVAVGDTNGGSGVVTIAGVSSDGVHHSTLKVTDGSFFIAGEPLTQVEVKDGGFLSCISGSIYIGDVHTVGKLHADGGFCGAQGITMGSRIVPSELSIENSGFVACGAAMKVAWQDGELANVSLASSGRLTVTDVLEIGAFGQAQ